MLTRRFLTVSEVAEVVQVSEATIRHWIKLRELRVIPHDFEAFLVNHETRRVAAFPDDAADGTSAMPGSRGEATPGLPVGASQPQDAWRNH